MPCGAPPASPPERRVQFSEEQVDIGVGGQKAPGLQPCPQPGFLSFQGCFQGQSTYLALGLWAQSQVKALPGE